MDNIARPNDPFGHATTRPIPGRTRYLKALRARRYSLRTYLCALALVILVPILFVGWWFTAHIAASGRSTVERLAEQEARGITALIDRDLQNAKNILTSLATSHHLRTDNLELFHRDASEVTRELGTPIVLREPGREAQLINTDVPWGTGVHRPTRAPKRVEAEHQVIRTKKPAISDVFFSDRIKGHMIAVVVPVIRDGIVKYTLFIGIPTEQFAAIIQSTMVPANWIVGIIDRDNVIVARSDRHNQFTGTRVHKHVYDGAKNHGVHSGTNREGALIQWSYRRSEVSGWFVTVGIPEPVLAGPYNRALAIYSVTSGLLLIVLLSLAYQIGGRISQRFGALGVDRKPTREEFQVLFESAPHGVLVADSAGRIVLANKRLERKFGYARGELTGHPSAILFSASCGNAQLQATGTERNELLGLRKDGGTLPIEISLNPIMTSGELFVMATVVDITARKRSEEKLHASFAERDDLRRRLMQAQENERLRLAHELHDQTGQSLAAVMLEMKSFETLVDGPGLDRLRRMRDQLEQMGKALHHVAWELRPASLDELGLRTALADHIYEWSARIGIAIDFQCSDDKLDDLPDEVRTVIYRVVQEGLTNIAKHAQKATTASVIIDRSNAMLQLTIEDDGDGFDVSSASASGDGRNVCTLGLVGMRERLMLIGANWEVESSVGNGTTIFARIPLERKRLAA